MAKAKTKKAPKPIRLRQVLTALKLRRVRATRALPMTQAEYAVALDKVIRAIGRSQPTGKLIVKSVRVL
jgi:hypothetical protein